MAVDTKTNTIIITLKDCQYKDYPHSKIMEVFCKRKGGGGYWRIVSDKRRAEVLKKFGENHSGK